MVVHWQVGQLTANVLFSANLRNTPPGELFHDWFISL
jgi:hypothetical protein